MDCINGLAKLVGKQGDHRVSLKNPDTVIVVEIFQVRFFGAPPPPNNNFVRPLILLKQTACGISVIPNGDYGRYDGYNIRKVCEDVQQGKTKSEGSNGAKQTQLQPQQPPVNEKEKETEKKEEKKEEKEEEGETQTVLQQSTHDQGEEEVEDEGLGDIKLF